MRIIRLQIKTKTQKYPILIGSNIISKFSKILNQNSVKFKQCLLIIDSNVPKTMILKILKSLKGKKTFLFSLNANEKNKSQKTVNSILKTLLI